MKYLLNFGLWFAVEDFYVFYPLDVIGDQPLYNFLVSYLGSVVSSMPRFFRVRVSVSERITLA